MPEGHTLHALARDLAAAFAGTAPLVCSPQGRFADGARLLDGHRVIGARAIGKHLLVEFDGERWLNVHLGLIGKFGITRFPEPLPEQQWPALPHSGQVRLRLVNARHVADLRGPTLCAVITSEQAAALTGRLGPDPLQPGADPAPAWDRIRRSRRSLAELLMDQSVLAGIGNVYRCEILFRHRLNPFTPGVDVKPRSWQAIWSDLVELMPLGVAGGQILTLPDQVAAAREELAATGSLTPPERAHAVYRRAGEPCLECGSRIRTQLLAGRNLFWCGRCQRRR
jgi:endonuclease VIII